MTFISPKTGPNTIALPATSYVVPHVVINYKHKHLQGHGLKTRRQPKLPDKTFSNAHTKSFPVAKIHVASYAFFEKIKMKSKLPTAFRSLRSISAHIQTCRAKKINKKSETKPRVHFKYSHFLLQHCSSVAKHPEAFKHDREKTKKLWHLPLCRFCKILPSALFCHSSL